MVKYATRAFFCTIFAFFAVVLWHDVEAGQEVSKNADYRYRSAPAEVAEGKIDWLGEIQKLFVRRKAQGKPEVPAEMAMELKLRIRQLSNQLLDNVTEDSFDDSAVIVSTFVNLNDLYETSGLGRLMSEQLMGELQKRGVEIIDARISTSLQVSEGFGEYALSRDMNQLGYVHAAQAVVVGTYSVAADEITVNARLLNQGNGAVLSSAGIVFPADKLVAALLRDAGKPPAGGSMVPLHSFAEIDPEK
jgi:TolB-like protein